MIAKASFQDQPGTVNPCCQAAAPLVLPKEEGPSSTIAICNACSVKGKAVNKLLLNVIDEQTPFSFFNQESGLSTQRGLRWSKDVSGCYSSLWQSVLKYCQIHPNTHCRDSMIRVAMIQAFEDSSASPSSLSTRLLHVPYTSRCPGWCFWLSHTWGLPSRLHPMSPSQAKPGLQERQSEIWDPRNGAALWWHHLARPWHRPTMAPAWVCSVFTSPTHINPHQPTSIHMGCTSVCIIRASQWEKAVPSPPCSSIGMPFFPVWTHQPVQVHESNEASLSNALQQFQRSSNSKSYLVGNFDPLGTPHKPRTIESVTGKVVLRSLPRKKCFNGPTHCVARVLPTQNTSQCQDATSRLQPTATGRFTQTKKHLYIYI